MKKMGQNANGEAFKITEKMKESWADYLANFIKGAEDYDILMQAPDCVGDQVMYNLVAYTTMIDEDGEETTSSIALGEAAFRLPEETCNEVISLVAGRVAA